jgi:hypothetical protein
MRIKLNFLVLFLMAFAVNSPSQLATSDPLFPQFVVGDGYETVVLITNLERWPLSVKWVPMEKDGSPWKAPISYLVNDSPVGQLPSTLEAKSTYKITFRGGSQLSVGMLLIKVYGKLLISYFYRFYAPDGDLQTTVGSFVSRRSSTPAYGAVFPVEESSTSHTGYAISNHDGSVPKYNPLIIELVLYDSHGNAVASDSVQYTGQISEFVFQRFPSISGGFLGYMEIVARTSTGSTPSVVFEILRMDLTKKGFLYTVVKPEALF